jgi:uncharacterized membrane protein
MSQSAVNLQSAISNQQFLRVVALVSLGYDAIVGAVLLLAPSLMATWFGVAPATPRIFSDLNGIFLLAVSAGYYLPWRDPVAGRWYMWVMGPGLKGAGAVAFVVDHIVRRSPASFLLFAASDGTLALITLAALFAGRGNTPARPLR